MNAAASLLAEEPSTDSLRYLRHKLTLVLASWGIDRVGEYRVYEAITADPLTDATDYDERMMALAGLADGRTADYVDTTYDAIKRMGGPYPQWKPSSALNCLYFIPGNSAVDVAKRIFAKEKDPTLRERALRVTHRPGS